ARKLGKIASGRNLEGEPRQRVRWAGLERDRLQPLLARKKCALAVALDQGEADDGGIVCNLPIDVGRGERGMAEPAHRDHRFPPERRYRPARAKVAPRGAAAGALACMLALMGREITPVSHRAERPEGKNVQASPAIGACRRSAGGPAKTGGFGAGRWRGVLGEKLALPAP